jgi:hypothetical protein
VAPSQLESPYAQRSLTLNRPATAGSRPASSRGRAAYDPNQYAREKAEKLERAKQIKAERMAGMRKRDHDKV